MLVILSELFPVFNNLINGMTEPNVSLDPVMETGIQILLKESKNRIVLTKKNEKRH